MPQGKSLVTPRRFDLELVSADLLVDPLVYRRSQSPRTLIPSLAQMARSSQRRHDVEESLCQARLRSSIVRSWPCHPGLRFKTRSPPSHLCRLPIRKPQFSGRNTDCDQYVCFSKPGWRGRHHQAEIEIVQITLQAKIPGRCSMANRREVYFSCDYTRWWSCNKPSPDAKIHHRGIGQCQDPCFRHGGQRSAGFARAYHGRLGYGPMGRHPRQWWL